MVPGLSNKTYPERLRTLKLPTLAYRRTRGDMIHLYKLICDPIEGAFDKTLPPLFEFFPRDVRGHNKKIVYKGFKKDIQKFNFCTRTVKLWNSLSQSVVDSNSIDQFEKT